MLIACPVLTVWRCRGVCSGCELEENVLIGGGTKIGREAAPTSVISNCVIGRNCTIGAGVRLTNAYVWDNVTIGDDCCIDQAILADGVVIKQEVTIKPGSLLSFDVVVGPSITIEHNTRISLKACNDADGFDDSDSDGDAEEEEYDPEEVGTEGKGRIWTPDDDDDVALMLWGMSMVGR